MYYWCVQCKRNINSKQVKAHKEEFPNHRLINEFYSPSRVLDKWNAKHPDDLHKEYMKGLARDKNEKRLRRVQRTAGGDIDRK